MIIAGGKIFKITTSRFVNVSEEEINLMKENAIPRNTKHATKFGMTHFKGKNLKIVLNLTVKILLMPTCMNKSMVSQQILTAVMTCIVVDKNTVHAKPHSICFLP